MDNFNDLLKQSLDYKQKRDSRYKEVSKDRLCKIAKKKVQTTMIGSLSSIEKHLGFLWGHGEAVEDLSPEQAAVRALFEEARAEILDRGNTQIRNLETEILNYDITWNKQTTNLKIKDN